MAATFRSICRFDGRLSRFDPYRVQPGTVLEHQVDLQAKAVAPEVQGGRLGLVEAVLQGFRHDPGFEHGAAHRMLRQLVRALVTTKAGKLRDRRCSAVVAWRESLCTDSK